jgi:hypothetical protein
VYREQGLDSNTRGIKSYPGGNRDGKKEGKGKKLNQMTESGN